MTRRMRLAGTMSIQATSDPSERLRACRRDRSALLDRPQPSLYNARRRANLRFAAGAQVAQLVEHVTENHGVGGSIPPLGTIDFSN
jgi:hypothetical protein